jgi:hypothetical protein
MSALSFLKQIVTGNRPAATPRRNARSRNLSLESLEKRQVMAGNVAAFAMDGNLHVDGDHRDNQVVVTEVWDRVYKVQGFAGTTINGRNEALIYASNQGLKVNLADGHDTLIVSSEAHRRTALRSLTVDMGRGNDQCYVLSTTVYGLSPAIINMGSQDFDVGADRFEMGSSGNHYGSYFLCSVVLVMGGGNDTASFWGGSYVDRHLSISMGSGHDTVKFSGCTAVNVGIDLGRGDDTISALGLRSQNVFVDGGQDYDLFLFNSDHAFKSFRYLGFERIGHRA